VYAHAIHVQSLHSLCSAPRWPRIKAHTICSTNLSSFTRKENKQKAQEKSRENLKMQLLNLAAAWADF